MRRVIGLVLVLLNLDVAPLLGREKQLYGTIRSLDLDNGTITVSVLTEGQPQTFSLLKRDLPVVDPLGKAVRLDDLQSQQRVVLTLDDGPDAVVALRLEADCRWGMFYPSVAEKEEIKVRIGPTYHTLQVPPDAQVFIEGQPAKLGDLNIQRALKLTYSPDHRRLLRIDAGRSTLSANPYCRLTMHSGIVLKTDHGRRTIEVVDVSERPRIEVFEYEAWAPLRLVYSSYLRRDSSMDALWPYARVTFYRDTDTGRISILSAEVPRLVRRPVTKVDLAARKLSLQVENGKTEEFSVGVDAKVVNNKGVCTFDQVKEGGLVTVGLTPDNREVLFLQVLPN